MKRIGEARTPLLAAGLKPDEVSSGMGNASVAITGSIYAHLYPTDDTNKCPVHPRSQQKTGGGRGIRTHETFLPTSFQDWLHRPLGQPSWRQRIGVLRESTEPGGARGDPSRTSLLVRPRKRPVRRHRE